MIKWLIAHKEHDIVLKEETWDVSIEVCGVKVIWLGCGIYWQNISDVEALEEEEQY